MASRIHPGFEDLYRVDGKAELVNGEIITMSGSSGICSTSASHHQQ